MVAQTHDINVAWDGHRGGGRGGTMSRNTIYAMAGGVVAAMVIAVGLFFYLQPSPNQGVPPLPANARMFNNWALVGCQPGGRCALLRRAVNQQTGTIVMQMTIVRAQNGSA